MNENYEELFQRIRTKCLQRRWHGPDISNPFEIVARERQRYEEQQEKIRQIKSQKQGAFMAFVGRSTHYWRDGNGKQYAINLETDLDAFPLQTDFEHPPLSEEELATIEYNWECTFPPLLRALYTKLANGGFGPAYGLSVFSPHIRHVEGHPIGGSRSRPVDLDLYLRRYSAQEAFEIPWYVWPESLIGICMDGCGYDFYLDCTSGRVFYGGAGRHGFWLSPQADSLEEWLELWLQGVELPIYRKKEEKSNA